jgi:hypothetical protein
MSAIYNTICDVLDKIQYYSIDKFLNDSCLIEEVTLGLKYQISEYFTQGYIDMYTHVM